MKTKMFLTLSGHSLWVASYLYETGQGGMFKSHCYADVQVEKKAASLFCL